MRPRPNPGGVPPQRALTTADLAAHLGLGASTVAAALRGDPRIAATTRLRVRAAADAAGYRRNVAASVLGSRRRPAAPTTVSAAFVTRLSGAGTTPYAEPLRAAFTASGWLFHTVNLPSARSTTAAARLLEARGVDALVLGPTTPTDLPLPPLPWERFAVVSVIRQRAAEGVEVVRVNHFASVLRLVHSLAAHGRRRIGVIHRFHSPALEDDDARLAAFLLLQRRLRGTAQRLLLHEAPLRGSTSPEARHRLAAWLDAARPDVVVGFNADDSTRVEETGRRVPDDVAFAAVHVHRRQRGTIAGLESPAEALADTVRLRVEQKLKLGEFGLSARPIETVLTPLFHPGATLPAAR